MKKRFLAATLSLCIAVTMAMTLLPTTAFAAGGNEIQLVDSTSNRTGGISGYDSGYDYIYYGTYDGNPVKWRVLDDQTNTGETGLFLLSDVLLGTGTNGGVYFDNTSPYDNTYQGSAAQAWCNTFETENLSTQELAAIIETSKNDAAFTSSTYSIIFAAANGILTDDQIFFLSVAEAENGDYGFTSDADRVANYSDSPGVWWLRSPGARSTDGAGAVYINGVVNLSNVNRDWAARPAFNLDLNSVLFTSAAAGGKSSGAEGAAALNSVSTTTPTEWKLTLKDFDNDDTTTLGHDGFTASLSDDTTSATVAAGGSVSIKYSGAKTGENEYVSAMLVDSSNNVLYYGNIAKNSASNTTGQTVNIPDGLTAGSYTLKVFSEQCNGNYKTDYASAFVNIPLTVQAVSATPTATTTTVAKTAATQASVQFNLTNTPAYANGQTWKVYTAGTGDTTVTGVIAANTGNTLTLEHTTDLPAGEYYVSVTETNKAESARLKLTVVAYAPTYALTVNLNGGNGGTAGGNYAENARIDINAGTKANYSFNGWTSSNGGAFDNPNSASTTFTMPAEDTTITANWTRVYALTVNLDGGNGSTTSGNYAENAHININAGTKANYSFNGWTSSNGGTFDDPSSASTTFTMPAGDASITANWTYNGSGGGGDTTDYYTLTFDTNGGSAVSSVRRAEYSTIDLADYTPTREGYTFAGWYSDRGLTQQITSVRLTKDTTVYAGWTQNEVNPNTGAGNPFTDVSEDDWFFDDVMFVFQKGLMIGVSDTLFDPHGTTTRAMTATVLWRMDGSSAPTGGNPFSDVASGGWYTDAITWAAENEIAGGYGGGLFGTNDPVTREQLAAFLYRYAGYKDYDTEITGSLSRFTDKDGISEWAVEAMEWAVGYGLIEGKDNNILDPQGNATRAEFAAMLQRFLEKSELATNISNP